MRYYPAHCKFRGFSGDVETEMFRRLTAHLRTNIDRIEANVEKDNEPVGEGN